MPEWADVVGSMIEQFGKDPATVNILLGFLKALVEEVGNPRLNVSVSSFARGVG
jgi:transportin-3